MADPEAVRKRSPLDTSARKWEICSPMSSPLLELATLLIENKVVELREGGTAADLAARFDKALDAPARSARIKAILAIFDDDPLIEEVYADQDELESIAKKLV